MWVRHLRVPAVAFKHEKRPQIITCCRLLSVGKNVLLLARNKLPCWLVHIFDDFIGLSARGWKNFKIMFVYIRAIIRVSLYLTFHTFIISEELLILFRVH